MKKSIVISFVDRVLFPDIPGIHTRFLLKEEDTGHLLTDSLAMHFIELGKVTADRRVEELDLTIEIVREMLDLEAVIK